MFEPSEEVIADLVAKARLSIPGIATAAEAIKVQRHNPHCIMALAHKSRFNPAAPSAEGFVAMLPLNALGMELLARDALEATRPNVKFLTTGDERPKGIYWWGVYAPGFVCRSHGAVDGRTSPPNNMRVWTSMPRPGSEAGRTFHASAGFVEGTHIGHTHAPH